MSVTSIFKTDGFVGSFVTRHETGTPGIKERVILNVDDLLGAGVTLTTRAPRGCDVPWVAPWTPNRAEHYRRLFVEDPARIDPIWHDLLMNHLFDDRDLYRYEFVASRLINPDHLYAQAVAHAFPDHLVFYSEEHTHHNECLILVYKAIGLREDCGYVGWWDDPEEEGTSCV